MKVSLELVHAQHENLVPPQTVPLLSRGFRPFFLLAAFFSVLLMVVWQSFLLGGPSISLVFAPHIWHAHEMIFGVGSAVVAGFLLTAVPHWTHQRAISGNELLALTLLWLAGRLGHLLATWLPLALVACVDMLFLPIVAVLIWRPIWAAKSRHNFGFPLMLLGLSLANVGLYVSALGGRSIDPRQLLYVGVKVLALMVVVVGGRIIPMFTQNALQKEVEIRPVSRVDRLAVVVVALALAADLVPIPDSYKGGLNLLAGFSVLARMRGWKSVATRKTPILWILHLGYLWISIGFLLFAAVYWHSVHVPTSTALHALSVGAVGTMMMAMMTRVALGHTGRPLQAPRSAVVAYFAITGAALVRSIFPIVIPTQIQVLVVGSGVLWILAFGAYLYGYAAILTQPRVDGRAG